MYNETYKGGVLILEGSWDDEYTTQRYLKLINTYSDFHGLSNDKRLAILDNVADFLDSKGGKIFVPQEVRLYMAKKSRL